ncbi:MAG: type II secretion system protein [Verrucomicrobiota bacterium]
MRRGFTLIELLVSFAIIAVIAGLAVPIFTTVLARADAAKCLGNLRGLGVALNSYLGENQMTMPPLAAARASTTEVVAVIDNTLDRYLDSPKVFTCPAGRKIAETTGTSYFWNSALSGQSLGGLNFFGFVTDPTRIPVLVDKEGWHKNTEDKVNHLFADGHATKELRLFTD